MNKKHIVIIKYILKARNKSKSNEEVINVVKIL